MIKQKTLEKQNDKIRQATSTKKPNKTDESGIYNFDHPFKYSGVNGTNSPPIQPTNRNVMFLQRTIGNQAVQQLYKSGYFQPKLKIGQPNDKYEQEADRVAEQVMNMSIPNVQRKPT